MTKTKNWILKVVPIVFVLLIVSTCIFAASFDYMDPDKINSDLKEGVGSETATKAIRNVWGTIAIVLQLLSAIAIIAAGIKYMFASADAKADIKKQTIALVIGAILVFASSTVINLVVSITNDIAGN